MKHLYQKCPVCDNTLDGTELFCPKCAFELRVLPQHLPSILREQEKTRIETAKRSYLRIREFVDNELSSKDRIGELENAINDFKNVLAQKDQVIYAKTKELNEKEKALNTKTSQVEQLTKDIAVYAGYHAPEVVDQLQKQISGLKEQLSKQQFSNSASSVVAYLIQFDDDEAQNIYALTEGDNSFGSAPNKTGHKQVLTGDLQLIHFTIHSKVEKRVNRKKVSFTVTPNQGGITIDNKFAKPITNGTLELDLNTDLYAGGLHFRLLPNKDFK